MEALGLSGVEHTVEVVLEKNFALRQPDFNDFDAVLDYVSRQDTVAKLAYRDFNYMINTKEPILVAPGISFELRKLDYLEKTTQLVRISYVLWTETLTIKDIKEFINKCRIDYEALKNNKLGDDMYFFDQAAANDSRLHQALSFDKKKFSTNRTFKNIFFEERPDVEERVNHFMQNRAWYDERGIPYTLGFMFFGVPGTGKTSTIKAIANVTRRHIINVRLSEVKTNTQLKNLFYNPVLQVINPETLLVEKFIVPIHQRLYVIEDIDCMTDLIRRRDYDEDDEEDEKSEKNEKKESVKETKEAKKSVEKKKPVEKFVSGDEELDDFFQSTVAQEKVEMAREKAEEDGKDKITLDALLNILDGTYEIPNRMLCITTNHLEVIDPALIRPGRVDMIIEFKRSTRAIIKQMFESFYRKKEPKDVKDAKDVKQQEFPIEMFAKIKDYKISPATVNQVLFKNFTTPDKAIAELVLISSKRKTYKKRDPSAKPDKPADKPVEKAT